MPYTRFTRYASSRKLIALAICIFVMCLVLVSRLVVFDDSGPSDASTDAALITPQSTGYWLTATDGGVFAFGAAPFLGSTGGLELNKPVVDMESRRSGNGYWFVASDGGVFSFGAAKFFGSTGDRTLNQPIVGMSSTTSGNGYWLVGSDGGVFAFGDAPFFGSAGNLQLNAPIVSMQATSSGDGYWLLAQDGGVFAYGDAAFYGSTGSLKLNQPVVSMRSTPSGNGYWFVASDGGVFTFGDAPFVGSMGGLPLNQPVVDMAASSSGHGYWLVARDGGIFTYGDSRFFGSMGNTRLNQPVVSVEATSSSGALHIQGNPFSPLYGLTLDDVSNIPAIVQTITALPKRPTVRVVFDEHVHPSEYAPAIQAIDPHAFIMGELLDSSYVDDYSVEQYKQRTNQYLDAFATYVDIWEIGNEVNGEWLGRTSDVVDKIGSAYDLVKSRGLLAAVTLYYNPDCWSRSDHEMFTWAGANLPHRMKTGIDYAFISYYEEDCNNYRPSNWSPVFDQLHAMFPSSKIGFGEVGMPDPATQRTQARAQAVMTYYYGLRPTTPQYVGGYFWWYAAEDVVPPSKPLFTTMHSVMSSM